MSPLLKEIETEARRRRSRLVLLSLPDYWRLARETKLIGCGCGAPKCVALPDAIETPTIRIASLPSFDDPPKYLRGK